MAARPGYLGIDLEHWRSVVWGGIRVGAQVPSVQEASKQTSPAREAGDL